MHKRARSWSSWLACAVVLLILAAGGVSLAGSQQSESDTQSLKNEVASLKSQAGAGQFMAEQALAGNVTQNFVEAQSVQMLKGVESSREKLTPEEFEPSLNAQVLRAADLALRLEGALKSLRDAGVGREGAESARRNLSGLYGELSGLEEELKR